MMKKTLTWLASSLFTIAMFDIGISSGMIFYQPEVPEALRK